MNKRMRTCGRMNKNIAMSIAGVAAPTETLLPLAVFTLQ